MHVYMTKTSAPLPVNVEWPTLVDYACSQRTDIPANPTTAHVHVPPRVITTQPTPAELKRLVDETRKKGE